MTDTRSVEDDWSSPTHYGSGRTLIEPRTFTEADPMTGLLGLGWGIDEDSEAESHAALWGNTTYVGKAARARRAADTATSTTDAAVDTDGADSDRGLMTNSRSMAVASLTSRITGFVRTLMLAAALGVFGVGNAYNAGNNFPNMVYELLLGGVLSSVLIPLLVKAQADDADDGVAYTQRLLSLATAALGVLTFAAVLAAPLIASAFSPPETRNLTSLFATLLLPEIFFYGLGAMFMAVLNIRHSYVAGAWSPVLNNVIMIVTVTVFWLLPGPADFQPSTITNAQILVLGIGTTLGIAAQALVLIPALRKTGFHWQWRFRALPNETGRIREMATLGAWVLVYVVTSQIGVSVIQYVGLHNARGFSVFTYADLLFQMPYGILVVSLLTAIMPRLSRAAAREDFASVVSDMSLGGRLSAVALIPVTIGLIALGSPLGVTLFGHGQTGIDGGRLIGSSLAWSAFGLFPFALVMLQMRVFYALRDGRTPTIINVGMVATKVVLVLVSDSLWSESHSNRAIEWLNISTSASYVVGALVGHQLLRRRLGSLGFGSVGRAVLQIGAASVAGGAVAYLVVRLITGSLGSGHLGSGAGLAGGALAGVAVLGLIIWRTRIPAVQQVREMFGR